MRWPLRSGGIPEIISDGESGRLVEAADPPALANGIIDLLEQTELAKKMAAQGQKIIRERFSIDAMVEQYVQVYQRIQSRH
jgi:glycosyltransferase involved in cell wall biosynthesis